MKKIVNDSPVTKEELKEVLKDYPTKNDLDERFSNFATAFRNENNHALLSMKEEILAGMSKFTNMILTAMDPLIKDMEIRREEREIASNQMLEVTDRVDNHEDRIKKLETS